jgi:hypothetical protein
MTNSFWSWVKSVNTATLLLFIIYCLLNVNFENNLKTYDLKTYDFDVSFMVKNSQQKTSQKTDSKFILGKPGGTILIQNFINNKKKIPFKVEQITQPNQKGPSFFPRAKFNNFLLILSC